MRLRAAPMATGSTAKRVETRATAKGAGRDEEREEELLRKIRKLEKQERAQSPGKEKLKDELEENMVRKAQVKAKIEL